MQDINVPLLNLYNPLHLRKPPSKYLTITLWGKEDDYFCLSDEKTEGQGVWFKVTHAKRVILSTSLVSTSFSLCYALNRRVRLNFRGTKDKFTATTQ